MNREARNPESRADQVDTLLGAFFQAEMPNPWPAFHAPKQTRLAPARPSTTAHAMAWSSRLALALALGVLLALTWMLPKPGALPTAERALPGAAQIGEDVAGGKGGREKGSVPAKVRKRGVETGR